MNLTFQAKYPGATPQEAYSDAVAGLDTVPFSVGWYNIEVKRFYESATYRDAVKDHDDDQLETFRESDWTWVATLKARG